METTIPVSPQEPTGTKTRRRLSETLGRLYPEEDFSDEEKFFGKLLTLCDESERKDRAIAALEDEVTAFNQLASEEALALRNEKETFRANDAASRRSLSDLAEKSPFGKEATEAAFEKLKTIAAQCSRGIVTPESVTLLTQGLRYEPDIAEARTAGEIAGRNAQIEEYLRKPEQEKTGVPELPRLGGTVITGGTDACETLGALGRYGAESSDIWQRGNPRRVRQS